MYEIGKISPEQFIADHTLVYIIKGIMTIYDGSKQMVLKSGDCSIARKNRLARYSKEKVNNELEKVFVFFDEAFLKRFQTKHAITTGKFSSSETLIPVNKCKLLPTYIHSLLPYYNHGKIKDAFSEVKREELLIILLEEQPELAGLLFDYGIPQKINLEEFMNRNYAFNVSIEKFAYLTGRSISAFKRDFKETFNDTPSRWLVQKRLQEAHFLIEKKNKKPSEIYIDLGFETLPHFSHAFKNQFGLTPSELTRQIRKTSKC